MPTPSSNPPPSEDLSRSHSFSTCPEEAGTRSPPTSWPASDAMQDNAVDVPDNRMAATSASDTVSDVVSRLETSTEAMTEDEPTSAVSSRATTMSPRPATATTSSTTSGSSATDADASKKTDGAGEDVASSSRLQSMTHAPEGARGVEHNVAGLMPRHDVGKGREAGPVDAMEEDLMAPSMGSDYPSARAIPSSPSSFLRAGSKFHGTQQSERQVYDVQVEIKHVDLKESFLCGYLRIQGLTDDHPTLTTYFEGEIIGTKYNFFTSHESWGATNRIDLNHWKKFTAFRPLEKQARKGPISLPDVAQRETIFMRWKEHFLVPDHRIRTISGASFEGFYYICFNQVKGEVSGIYFHAKSEKFQQLELKHVEDRGCFSAVEFR